ncbi:hypothetical protein [Roseisalinus antarcticus]|uniref:hypothetical protein n=1 Tax=Roseisalinus antarcticus TaxID=254357 RepID=UPI0013562F74|nr:hypothetical protein [Roseisalinus antarcticus]
MDMFAHRYSAADVAEIARIKPPTLQAWLKRYERTEEAGPSGGGRQGKAHSFNYFNVMHFVIAAELVDQEVDTPQALKASAHFGQAGSIPSTRSFGLPFDEDGGRTDTMLLTSGNGTCIVPMRKGEDWWTQGIMLLGNPSGAFCMPILRVWQDACRRMKVSPGAVRAAAKATT